MNTNNNTNELDTIIELTDTVTSQSPVMPQNAIHDEAIFDSLKTLKTTNGASFMPPYADAPSTPKNDAPNAVQAPAHNAADNTISNDEIIELDSNAVVHPQYTVTTELFSTPLAFGEQKKQSEKIESVHIDTVHINTICASKTLCDSLHLEADAPHVPTDVPAPVVKDVKGVPDIQDETTAPKPVHDAKIEELGDIKEPLAAHESMEAIFRNVSLLQETVAKMQSRLAAQDASIASLEARLVVAEAKNRELAERCCQVQAPQFDEAQLEKVTAAVAAKVVREEIQALLDIVER